MTSIRTLIVEDEPADAELAVLELSKEGIRLDWRCVGTEREFLTELDSNPELILADWNLPQFSGSRALQLLRERNLDIPFIIFSGGIGEEAAIDALRLGAYDYVWKDKLARLPAAVRHALNEKSMREERRRAEGELRKFARVVEQTPVSVVITALDGSIEYVNPKFTDVTGYTIEEVLGKNPRILKSGEAPAEEYQRLWDTITQGREWRGEFHNRRKDGGLFWERATISPLRDGSGAITHYLAVKEDVTAQKSLEQQFLQAQKLESVGRLAGGVAHDFNNLLTVINGYSEVLLKELQTQDAMYEPVAEIRAAGARAASLTQQLLTFSRRQVLQLENVDLNGIIKDLHRMLGRLIGEDIELLTRFAPSVPRIRVDKNQMHQVIMNLLVNARDAMPNGGRIIIETSTADFDSVIAESAPEEQAGSYVILSVSDNGSGMDDGTKGRIFEPFFTTKEAGAGTGLGLSTVYGIVAQSGGKIWVDSEVGRGTTMKLYFPVAVVSEVLEEVKSEPEATAHGDETILLVEDQPEVRKLAQTSLEEFGYRVLAAGSGDEALRLSERHDGPIQLLATDVILPGLNGRELADLLLYHRPEMKVLYLSGYTDTVLEPRGVRLDDRAFLAKPFTPQSLATKVRSVLNTSQGPRAILVADDDPGIRRWLRSILTAEGHRVLEAADGEQALVWLRAHEVDLVLMDLIMPKREGLETIRAAKRMRPALKIIAMSGAMGVYLKTAKWLGAHETLAKPLERETLLQTIEKVLKT